MTEFFIFLRRAKRTVILYLFIYYLFIYVYKKSHELMDELKMRYERKNGHKSISNGSKKTIGRSMNFSYGENIENIFALGNQWV